jgi:hypothetical protein
VRDGEALVLERWDLASGVEKRIARRVTDYNGVDLAFSPDGRHRFVVAPRRDVQAPGPTQVFDADTLDPIESPHLADAWGVAGGTRGETFVSAEQYTVDLVDTATLQPRRRLYEGPPPPNVWSTIACFALWLVFAVRLIRKRRGERGPK